MRYFKLFIISMIVFGFMLYCISLLFPANTIVSRAVNIKGRKDRNSNRLPDLYYIAFQQKETIDSPSMDAADVSKKEADTLARPVPFATDMQQGVAVYQLASDDSTAVQVFYQIHVPWYKPWNKFGLMLNEAKYGPSLDSAIARIKRMSE